MTSSAYAGSPLTLSEAIQIALQNRLEIGISDQNILKSKAGLIEAKSEAYPRLDITGNSRYTKTIEKFEPIQVSFDFIGMRYTISPTKDVPEYQSDVSLQVTQRLFTGGRISGKIEGSKERVGQVEEMKELNRRDIMLSVTNAYWELKRTEKMAEIEKDRVRYSETILDVANGRYEKGAISGLEREKAEVDVINNRGDLLQAETTRRIAEDRLLKEMGIIGTDKEVSLILKDEPVYDFSRHDERIIEGAAEQAVQSRPEIKQIKSRIMADEADVKVARANYYPQMDLIGEYNWIGWGKDSLEGAWRDMDSNYWAVLLKINFNLFEGFATKSRVNQANAELTAHRLEIERQRQLIITEVRRAYNNMVGTAERINTLQRNLSLSEKNLEAAKKQFELGVITINQVAEYNISLADTKKRYINALIDFEIAKGELKWASGEELLRLP
ncbi:MAG: TolC family protein [Nitrospinae bacterium]|nr:TolC family protein [Nitrospinota bacterium]